MSRSLPPGKRVVLRVDTESRGLYEDAAARFGFAVEDRGEQDRGEQARGVDTCYEVPCPRPIAWLVRTAAGEIAVCEPHSRWYRSKGPDIYPSRRFVVSA